MAQKKLFSSISNSFLSPITGGGSLFAVVGDASSSAIIVNDFLSSFTGGTSLSNVSTILF